MKINVLGLGYIGLPTAIMFAKYGHDVLGVDVVENVVDKLNAGEIHIEEPGLQQEFEKVRQTGKFKATLKNIPADVFIISVPTPNLENPMKSCDLTYVSSALDSVIKELRPGNTVIVESTIPPLTMRNFIKPAIENAGFIIGKDVFLVHCPERVLPGKIMMELIHNNRIIGGMTSQCINKGIEIYGTFVKGELLATDASSAELSKLMENTFRDVNIALANELVKICSELDINALEVIDLANKHPRVNIHSPGPGVGGHCLAVDPYFISAASPSKSPLIQESRKVNATMPYYLASTIEKVVARESIKKITMFGATYKGNIDDIRESPALNMYKYLSNKLDIPIVMHDPHVHEAFVEENAEQALVDSELLVLLVDHLEFEHVSLLALDKMKRKLVLDTKNILAEDIRNNVEYYNLGTLCHL